MIVCIIGLGLIGGSIAIDLKKRDFATKVIGVDHDPTHCATAQRMGFVDDIQPLDTALAAAELIVVAVPVDAAMSLLPLVLDRVTTQVVTDVCSTKASIAEAVADHPRRARFVGGHPMAGTENSGPWAALAGLFEGKVGILCDVERSDPDAVECVTRMYDALYMRVEQMDSATHDIHVAYVSHISHVGSYALALTVLEQEHDQRQIFNLASGGFSSTARLAKSSADMWTPIFVHNRDNVLRVLDTYVEKMQALRRCIAEDDRDGLHALITEANRIRRVL
jgi:prephenate dehydrogenase